MVEDILVRKPVHFEEDQIRGLLEGKLFSYWRAGGSIGSELCRRQIARFRASRP